MKKIITYGTFDLFHEGHYRILERAKALGDYLIVGITTEHYDETRGKVNVIDPIMTRIENVQKTGFADMILVEDHEGQKIEDIQKYGVDIFTLGSDWEGKFDYLKAFCDVVYLDRTPSVSSTQIRQNKYKIINIGIIGTGRIAPRFIEEAKYVSAASVCMAYNPEKLSAYNFRKRTGLKTETDNQEAFYREVDAVYIASPHETHYEYAKEAIERGKHVLCEKPLTFTKREAVELYELASRRDVVLMEGIKTAYCPGFIQMMNVAKSGRIGEIRDVEACFSRIADPNSREMMDARYGGAFLEYAGYPLLPIIKLLGVDHKDIRFQIIPDKNGIDIYTKIQFEYARSFATAKMGVGVKSEGQLVIAGTEGYILAPSPWWLTKSFDIRYENPMQVDHYEPRFQGDGLRYEISEFVQKINGIDRGAYKLTASESIAMAEIVEKFLRLRES